MLNLFEYTEYRLFLKDYYLYKKDLKKQFSYKLLSNQIGFESKSFIQEVIKGNRNLSKDSTFKLISYFDFDTKKSTYFQDLIGFDQAKTTEEREFFLTRIVATNCSGKIKKILKEQYDFYSHWHHNTVRELVLLPQYAHNLKLLGKMLNPPLTEALVKKSVSIMLDLGILKKISNGYDVSSPSVTTGDEVASTLISMFHNENLKLAQRSLDEITGRDRDVSCVVLRLSKNDFPIIKQEIQEFRKRIASMESSSDTIDKVYHFNMQIFPTTQSLKVAK